MGRNVVDDRAEQRQAIAERIRHDHRKTSTRTRITGSLVVLLGVLACIALLIWLQVNGDDDTAEVTVPAHATDDYGFTLTPELVGSEPSEGTVPVSLYEDFLCPSCKVFHEESGPFLAEQVANGTITLTYHPFTFLLRNSTDEYTQRASNAAVCVGDQVGPVGYAKMHDLLLSNQPDQGGPGLSDEQLIAFAEEAGAEDIAECIEERTFTPWVEEALAAGQAAGVTVTPTVRINGMTVVRSDNGRESMPGPAELEFAIAAAQ